MPVTDSPAPSSISASEQDALVAARQAKHRPTNPTLGVVVPVFNEEDAVSPFLDAMRPILDETGTDWSILFVNDGSQDKTFSILLQEIESDPRLSVINLARNFGKEAALTAGIDKIDTDAVIIIDVDLQDPPELIKDFVLKWKEGYDVVYGMREARASDTWLKRWTATRFYSVFNRVSTVEIPNNVGDFRLIDRRVVEALQQLKERNRFMKGLFAWVGFPSAAVPYQRPVRAHGETKFSFRRLWNFALDGIFGFSTLPLKAWTYCGLMVAIAAVLYAGYIIIRTMIFGVDVPGYASLLAVVLVMSAAQLISLGIIGEYLARLTLEAKQRPNYIIEHHYRGDEA